MEGKTHSPCFIKKCFVEFSQSKYEASAIWVGTSSPVSLLYVDLLQWLCALCRELGLNLIWHNTSNKSTHGCQGKYILLIGLTQTFLTNKKIHIRQNEGVYQSCWSTIEPDIWLADDAAQHCSNCGWLSSGETETVFAFHRTTAQVCVWLTRFGTLWLFHGFLWHEQQELAELQVPVARP